MNAALSALRVVEAGMLSTVQDLGRVGYRGAAVVGGGAADRLALRLGNRLVGNDENCAAIEMTLTGGTFEAVRPVRALVAGDCETLVRANERSNPDVCWRAIELARGDRLIVGAMRRGVRAYVCVAGGVEVPLVLGSRSTHLAAAFGGFDGRALRRGDELAVGECNQPWKRDVECDAARLLHETTAYRTTLRCIDSAHTEQFSASAVEALYSREFEISNQSDRRGVRLVGSIGPDAGGGALPSEGMMPGAIQVPPSGEPIVLGVDHPATGGYPLIGCVIEADHAALAQLRPRQGVRFRRVTIDDARVARRRLEAQICGADG